MFYFFSTYDSLLSVSSTVKLSSSLTSISLASPTEKTSVQNPFWYSLDGDDGFMAVAAVAAASGSISGSTGSELRPDKRGAYYALAKNPDKYVSYQQAQQQTEDLDDDDLDEEEDEDPENPDLEDQVLVPNAPDQNHDDEDEDSEKIIHL